MGFGSLFIGYFLFLNVTYHGITDIMAALVMLFGLTKLKTLNKPFRYCNAVMLGFSGFTLVELVTELIRMFGFIGDIPLLFSIISMVRSIFVFSLTYFMLCGMQEVAKEVDLPSISKKCKSRIPSVIIVYALWVLLDALGLFGSIPPQIPAIVSVVTLLATVVLVAMNLSLIYNCYMQICMPEDLIPKEPKLSKFEFINKFRQHEEEKQREYAEYKMRKFENKMEKLKEKAKKNGKK